MKSYSQFIAALLLILFCAVQLIDLHAIDHHDTESTDCHICVLTSDHQNDDYTPTAILSVSEVFNIPVDIESINYLQPHFNN